MKKSKKPRKLQPLSKKQRKASRFYNGVVKPDRLATERLDQSMKQKRAATMAGRR